MLEEKKIVINQDIKVSFHNNVDFCIGTGRMGLALTQEYQEQLRLVQDEIGFRHIRGHGLFCDDMAIYHEYEENGIRKVEYNYTYLDRVMDFYRSVGLRPFWSWVLCQRSLHAAHRQSFTGKEIRLRHAIIVHGVRWYSVCCVI